jgi:hypothetical protein
MRFLYQINYSGLTFNNNDEFYFDGERIIIVGFWVNNEGKISVDLKRKFPIIQQTLSIDELFNRYGNQLKTKINNTVINNIEKNCIQYLK